MQLLVIRMLFYDYSDINHYRDRGNISFKENKLITFNNKSNACFSFTMNSNQSIFVYQIEFIFN